MQKRFFAALITVIVLSMASNAYAVVVNLLAIDTKAIATNNDNLNDNRLRAYFYRSSTGPIDGFMKFDFSSIPDTAVFTSMTLTTYHEYGYSNPYQDPQVKIYRTVGDSWARGQSDTHPGLNEVLTSIHSGFPAGDLAPYEWELDVSAVDWQEDLNDDILSLVMRNEKSSYSYVYWYGSDPQYAPPKLSIEYELNNGGHIIPEPSTIFLLGSTLLGLAFRRKKI